MIRVTPGLTIHNLDYILWDCVPRGMGSLGKELTERYRHPANSPSDIG